MLLIVVLKYNAETIAAMREANDIIAGKIQAKSYTSFQEMVDEIEAKAPRPQIPRP